MKKSIIIASFALGAIVFGTTAVKAQVGTNSNPVSTTVNLILADVISIDEGSVASNGVVDFNYNNTTDYNNAKNVTVNESLIITSSRNFDVKVKAEGENFFVSGGSDVIPVNVLQVKAVTGGTMAAVTFGEVTLSDANQVLVGNATLGPRKSLNIDYSISAENASNVLLGKAPGTYTQKVTYTATAL